MGRKRLRRQGKRNGYRLGRNPVTNLSPRVTDGVYRLRDTLTLSSSAGGDLKQYISRSYTQFTEEKSLSAIYTLVRLLAFEVSITPARIYAKTDSDEKNLSTGWMTIGTTPVTQVAGPSTGNTILAQSDSRQFFLRNRITPFEFKSMIPREGYLPTPFASETSYTFAGSPGSVFIGNMLTGSEAASTDLMYVIITGIYHFSGRTT